MDEPKRNRFTKYFPLLLNALRSSDPAPMRPAEARAWIRAHCDVASEDLTRLIKAKSKQTIFDNDVHWTRFYLFKAGLVTAPKHGFWGLTPEGRVTELTPEKTWEVYVRVRDANRSGVAGHEEELPAPGFQDETPDDVAYWFVGGTFNDESGKARDRTDYFLANGIWENGYGEKNSDLVRQMRPGDRIAIKTSFNQRGGLPFEVGGQPVSVMRIKATGTILKNLDDARRVEVGWNPLPPARDWYFYTYLKNVVQANTDQEAARRLISFTFAGEPQDYKWFLAMPFWAQRYGANVLAAPSLPGAQAEALPQLDSEVSEVEEAPTYTVKSIIEDGCFLETTALEEILARWKSKKNLILQGPPGTGKTWLAKRLGFALVGSNDRETARSRLRVVQFHPSLSYEDFVRGWRPEGDGQLKLVDGIFMQAIDAANSEQDRPFVLVVEEINRGNPAQIFGEMLTLIESSKRDSSEALELAYRRTAGERVHVPENLYLIGTISDRRIGRIPVSNLWLLMLYASDLVRT